MNLLKKINYIFDKKQKVKLIVLFISILIGSFFELLGVSAIFPLVNIVMDSSIIEKNEQYSYIYKFLNMQSVSQFILTATVALIMVYIVKNIYILFMYNLQFRFTYNNQKRVASRMMTYYMRQDYVYHLSKNSAELQRNVTQDISMFSATVLSVLELFTEIFVSILLVGYLFLKDIKTTMLVASLVLVFAAFFYVLYKRVMVKWGRTYRKLNAQVIKWIQQSLGGIKEIKILNREEYFLGVFNRNYDNTMKYLRRQKLIGAVPRPVMETICICGLLVTIGIRIATGEEISNFIPTLSVFAVAAFRMLPSFNRITSYMSIITFNKAAIDAVYEELRMAEEFEKKKVSKEKREILTFDKDIKIRNLTYKYPNTEKNVVDGVNLLIKKNQSIAFIGPSGSGKTTLVDLILGVLQPKDGFVETDGKNIHANIEAWHSYIGYIPQSIYLMDDTIRNNVAFGIREEEISEEKVWEALKKAQLVEFVEGLEQGLDTEIGEKGVRLSGGQRQRIGIARTLYMNPPILILDEATSALDNETERAVMESINCLIGVKTLIVIAHRLTTIVNCDTIYEVNEGKILEVDKTNILDNNRR